MSEKQEYALVHRMAKLIIALLVCTLMTLGAYTDILLFDYAAVFTWLFGVNFLAWGIEEILHFKHKHEKL